MSAHVRFHFCFVVVVVVGRITTTETSLDVVYNDVRK